MTQKPLPHLVQSLTESDVSAQFNRQKLSESLDSVGVQS
jgi:hypothetical protein